LLDVKPISIVEGEGFREFMNTAVPEYFFPCRTTITRQINQLAKVKMDNFKVVFKNIPDVDFWTSMANNCYLDLTCHFLDSWKLLNTILETVEVPESHTSENISNNLQSLMRDWQIEHSLCYS